MTRRLMLLLCLLLSSVSCNSSGGSAHLFRRWPELDIRVFSCTPDPHQRIINSASELELAFKDLAAHCEAQQFQALRSAFLVSVTAAGIDWTEQSLVIVQDWYGTGMAKASLELESAADLVRASIEWKVPPPPVTPDTAVCRFAFTVMKRRVSKVEVNAHGAQTILLVQR